MSDCTGLFGRIFGHKFQPRYVRGTVPSQLLAMLGPDTPVYAMGKLSMRPGNRHTHATFAPGAARSPIVLTEAPVRAHKKKPARRTSSPEPAELNARASRASSEVPRLYTGTPRKPQALVSGSPKERGNDPMLEIDFDQRQHITSGPDAVPERLKTIPAMVLFLSGTLGATKIAWAFRGQLRD